MKILLFPYYVLVVLFAYNNPIFANDLSYHDKAKQCSEHGYKLCWRYCLVAEKQTSAGQTTEIGKKCDAEHNKKFMNTTYQSKTDPNYLPSGSIWFDGDVIGIYRRNAGRSRHVIDAPTNSQWKLNCSNTVRIEPSMIESLMVNGKRLHQGTKVRLSKIQIAATTGNSFSCKAGQVDVLD